jgi:hypothetical protein
MKSLLFCVGSFLGAIFTTPVGVASTPDGETPALEHVCDGYQGAAFGLCNAYCEAMDCDDDPNADQEACDKVEDKFVARTGRDIPCGGLTCGDFIIKEQQLRDIKDGEIFECRAAPSEKAITCVGPSNTVWECFNEEDGCRQLAGCYVK